MNKHVANMRDEIFKIKKYLDKQYQYEKDVSLIEDTIVLDELLGTLENYIDGTKDTEVIKGIKKIIQRYHEDYPDIKGRSRI